MQAPYLHLHCNVAIGTHLQTPHNKPHTHLNPSRPLTKIIGPLQCWGSCRPLSPHSHHTTMSEPSGTLHHRVNTKDIDVSAQQKCPPGGPSLLTSMSFVSFLYLPTGGTVGGSMQEPRDTDMDQGSLRANPQHQCQKWLPLSTPFSSCQLVYIAYQGISLPAKSYHLPFSSLSDSSTANMPDTEVSTSMSPLPPVMLVRT